MKPVTFSAECIEKLTAIKKLDSKLYKKIEKQLLIFQANPRHPSLRLHKLQGKLKNTWSLSVTRDFRMIFTDNEVYYFFDLGTHAEIYQNH